MTISKGKFHYKYGGSILFMINDYIADGQYQIQEAGFGGVTQLKINPWIQSTKNIVNAHHGLNDDSRIMHMSLDTFYEVRETLQWEGYVTITY